MLWLYGQRARQPKGQTGVCIICSFDYSIHKKFLHILGFAAAGCLHKKATVAGLKFWLNSAGIRTKAKDKKDDLVKKALEKLGYPTATEEECMAPIEQ